MKDEILISYGTFDSGATMAFYERFVLPHLPQTHSQRFHNSLFLQISIREKCRVRPEYKREEEKAIQIRQSPSLKSASNPGPLQIMEPRGYIHLPPRQHTQA